MKGVLKILLVSLHVVWVSSCALNEKTKENFNRGMYDGANQVQLFDRSFENSRGMPIQDQEPQSYEQYSEERRQMTGKGVSLQE